MRDIDFVKQSVADHAATLTDANDKIWEYAELSYKETRSADLLCSILEEEGFTVVRGIAGMPTAFTATYSSGTGKPVAGILGEFDALPTLSQKAGCTVKSPLEEGAPGHGCGHSCLGTGALGAALAVKEYLVSNHQSGTVIYYGCPAEEGDGAKQFMARAGVFDGVDFVYTWHPANKNTVTSKRCVAIMGANFSFQGVSAHAGGTPHLGRSALDAVELMSVGVNYLREHMIDKARIHYAYLDAGGRAANIVQDHAVVKYEVRAPKVTQMKELFERVVKVAKGAAMMTETEVTYEVTMAFSDYVPNDVLGKVASDCLVELGAPEWTEEDYRLAKGFLDSYDEGTRAGILEELAEEYGEEELKEVLERPLDQKIRPYNPLEKDYSTGSTDVGDVGYAAPTLELNVATACVGNVGHTWQMTGQAGSEIGHKGLLRAAEAIALSVIRTMESEETMAAAKHEYVKKTGGVYHCPLPDSVKPVIR